MKSTFAFLMTILILSIFSSCNVGKKILKEFSKNETELQEKIGGLAQAAVKDAMIELNKDSNFLVLRSNLDTLLDSLFLNAKPDLDAALSGIPDSLLGDKTDALIKARMATISASLYVTLDSLKNSLTDEQFSNFFKKLIKEQIQNDLTGLIVSLRAELFSDKTVESIATFRKKIQGQMDSLLGDAIIRVSNEADSVLFPRIHDVLDRVDGFKDDSKKILNGVLLGIAGLLLLATILYFWRQSVKRAKESKINEKEFKQHKQIVSIITRNIDKIENQKIYDKVVGQINKEMLATGLESKLRKVLEEEGLDHQPEWEQKDHAVLQLLLEEIKSAKPEEQDKIIGKAKELDLGDHLKSILKK